MKKLIKSNKGGFTLVEVMLAVAILAIASTMIMQGFLALLNYSHNSKVLTEAAAENYGSAMTKVVKKDTAGSSTGSVSINYGAMTIGETSWNVVIWKYNNDGDNYNAVKSATTEYNESVSYSDNRTSFVFKAS